MQARHVHLHVCQHLSVRLFSLVHDDAQGVNRFVYEFFEQVTLVLGDTHRTVIRSVDTGNFILGADHD